MSDLSVDNITAHTIQTNSSCPDPRTRYIFERLVTHLHDFARETRLSTPEWIAAITFLTQTGQKCTDTRQEFILLSDILGLSSLLDSIDHPSPPGTTQGTLLGPFHTHDAQHLPAGAAISHDTSGKPLFVLCTVRATDGTPLKDVQVDIWHADSTGLYDVQYPQRDTPEGRAVLHSDASGRFWFSAIQPVPYPVPDDGPVDAVFGVKSSLVVDYGVVDEAMGAEYGVPAGMALLRHEFVLATVAQAREERDRNSIEALRKLGRNVKIVDGLPVPDVD
ncbi:catechol dioxygenase, putative [Trichophyton benhamiae CBS 112371]|uniref:Catechol dioxygenase, putative n=1 Tax=Arthroderma benhamiae (strain ATCC MYA-4681 / CBS 112371) TaxID=663331 RepID=D4B0T4_ARTBC|nr:catechol dioxygenase, putative [Trichophyton benhamiae CBS 112371]EFE30869.1 catechol dioxygenase, putative [Trichophyton benhamiae CBS 112371]